MRLLGPARGPREVVLANSVPLTLESFRLDVFPHLWEQGLRHGVDPVGVYAQAIKETGGGRFPGRVKPEARNTCGLKIRHLGIYGPPTDGDEPAAHAMFASWEVGALAHVQHLRAYAGAPIIDELIVDPRYWLVRGQACERWADLGGRWAPSPTYGQEIEALMARLIVQPVAS